MTAFVVMLMASQALAHRGHNTLSIVDIDTKGVVTVTHVLSAHDTEPELVTLAPDAQPSVDDPEALKALERHLSRNFTVNGQALELVSTEFKGDDLTLVYRGKLKSPAKTVTIDYDLFPDSETAPVGMVNVHENGVVKSLTFLRGDGPQAVDFPS